MFDVVGEQGHQTVRSYSAVRSGRRDLELSELGNPVQNMPERILRSSLERSGELEKMAENSLERRLNWELNSKDH